MTRPAPRRCAAVAAAIAALALTAAQGARGTEAGGGAATGSVSCTNTGAALDAASPAILLDGKVRTLALSMGAAKCQPLSADFPYAQGPAAGSGDGVTCGADPDKPFVGAFAIEAQGHEVVGAFSGSCVVDGTERHAEFAVEAAVSDGTLVGTVRLEKEGQG